MLSFYFIIAYRSDSQPIIRFRQAASGKIEKIALQETGDTWILPR